MVILLIQKRNPAEKYKEVIRGYYLLNLIAKRRSITDFKQFRFSPGAASGEACPLDAKSNA